MPVEKAAPGTVPNVAVPVMLTEVASEDVLKYGPNAREATVARVVTGRNIPERDAVIEVLVIEVVVLSTSSVPEVVFEWVESVESRPWGRR